MGAAEYVAHVPSRLVRALAIAAALGYLAAVTAFLVSHGSWPTPDFLIPPLLLIAVFAGRGWRFVIDWLPFLVLILLYEGSRGVADNLNTGVHFQQLVDADKWLVGSDKTPPTLLQDWFFHPGRVMWYDWLASILHMAHFVVPTAFAFYLWVWHRTTYWRFVVTYLAMYFVGFIGYVVYPAAPPWMAADAGLIPPIHRVLVDTLSQLHATQGMALIYRDFSPNDVAAMPSLHAASPVLLTLAAFSLWGWRAAPAVLYMVAGNLAWMYLGEHWLIDEVFGWALAVAAFALVWLPLPWLTRRLARGVRVPSILTGLKPLPAWPLAIASAAFIVYVWIDPLMKTQPVAKLETIADLKAVPCGTRPPINVVDQELHLLTDWYAAYVLGPADGVCLSISARQDYPPPPAAEIASLPVETAAGPWATLNGGPDPSARFLLLTSGLPSPELQRIAPSESPQPFTAVIVLDNPTVLDTAASFLAKLRGVLFLPDP